MDRIGSEQVNWDCVRAAMDSRVAVAWEHQLGGLPSSVVSGRISRWVSAALPVIVSDTGDGMDVLIDRRTID